MRLVGTEEILATTLGGLPTNWAFLPHDDGDAVNLFAPLDFCVCYPRIEALGMLNTVPIQAMAVGVPIILPPRLYEVYGDGAVPQTLPEYSTLSTTCGGTSQNTRGKLSEDFNMFAAIPPIVQWPIGSRRSYILSTKFRPSRFQNEHRTLTLSGTHQWPLVAVRSEPCFRH